MFASLESGEIVQGLRSLPCMRPSLVPFVPYMSLVISEYRSKSYKLGMTQLPIPH